MDQKDEIASDKELNLFIQRNRDSLSNVVNRYYDDIPVYRNFADLLYINRFLPKTTGVLLEKLAEYYESIDSTAAQKSSIEQLYKYLQYGRGERNHGLYTNNVVQYIWNIDALIIQNCIDNYRDNHKYIEPVYDTLVN